MEKVPFILFLSSENCAVHEFDKGGHRALIIVARLPEQEKVLEDGRGR